MASLLAGSWTIDEASSAILQTIASVGDWVVSALWVYDEAIGRLRCRAYWHAGATQFEKFGQLSASLQFGIGEGSPGRVWKANQPAWIPDVQLDKNFPRAPAAREAGLHGRFAFPLFAGHATNGVIELFSERVVEPDPDLLQLVTALGSQVGLFIERRRVENELGRAKENAEAANAAKDRFLANLSHELRTPLSFNCSSKKRTRNDLVRHAIEIVRADLDGRHIQLAVDLDARSHRVSVHPPCLQQVFWNVLRNACKFTPENGAVSVRTYNPSPKSISVEIADNGVGIQSEHLTKIFDAFEQFEARREGLGLGLAISKAIVEMHGGSISARSAGLGEGSTFTVTLPVVN